MDSGRSRPSKACLGLLILKTVEGSSVDLDALARSALQMMGCAMNIMSLVCLGPGCVWEMRNCCRV